MSVLETGSYELPHHWVKKIFVFYDYLFAGAIEVVICIKILVTIINKKRKH